MADIPHVTCHSTEVHHDPLRPCNYRHWNTILTQETNPNTQNTPNHQREMNSTEMEPKEPHPWKNSEAQRVLKALMVSGEIRCEKDERIPPLQVWNKFCKSRQEFAVFQFSKFGSRLRAMQERHIKETGPQKREMKSAAKEPKEPHAQFELFSVWFFHCLMKV